MTLARRAAIILPLAATAILLGLMIATQQVAAAFHYPREFGPGLFDSGTVRIYAPWTFVGWYIRFGTAYPEAFDLAGLIALAVALVPSMFGIALSRRTRREPPRFGADAWAGLADVQKA